MDRCEECNRLVPSGTGVCDRCAASGRPTGGGPTADSDGLFGALERDAVTLRYALRFPLAGGPWRFAGACLLVPASVLGLPALVAVGYLLAATEAVVGGNEEPPPLTEFWTLAKRGTVGLVVGVGYLTPLVALSLAVGTAVPSVPAPVAVGVPRQVAGLAAALATLLVYLGPAVGVTYATTRSVRTAYASGYPVRFAASGPYARSWLVTLVAGAVLLAAATAPVPTRPGPPVVAAYGAVALPVAVYVALALAAYWASVYRRSPFAWAAGGDDLVDASEPDGDASTPPGFEPSRHSLRAIDDIEPEDVTRLRDAGVRSIPELVRQDADELAAETGIYYGRIEKWQERAREQSLESVFGGDRDGG